LVKVLLKVNAQLGAIQNTAFC